MSQHKASRASWRLTKPPSTSFRRNIRVTICLQPVFIFRRNLVQTTAEDLSRTPCMLWQSLTLEKPAVGQVLGVHVDDAAEAHVRALAVSLEDGDEGDTKGVPSYLLAAKRRSWALALLTARTMVLALQEPNASWALRSGPWRSRSRVLLTSSRDYRGDCRCLRLLHLPTLP